jgi:hypothetical protein
MQKNRGCGSIKLANRIIEQPIKLGKEEGKKGGNQRITKSMITNFIEEYPVTENDKVIFEVTSRVSEVETTKINTGGMVNLQSQLSKSWTTHLQSNKGKSVK